MVHRKSEVLYLVNKIDSDQPALSCSYVMISTKHKILCQYKTSKTGHDSCVGRDDDWGARILTTQSILLSCTALVKIRTGKYFCSQSFSSSTIKFKQSSCQLIGKKCTVYL